MPAGKSAFQERGGPHGRSAAAVAMAAAVLAAGAVLVSCSGRRPASRHERPGPPGGGRASPPPPQSEAARQAGAPDGANGHAVLEETAKPTRRPARPGGSPPAGDARAAPEARWEGRAVSSWLADIWADSLQRRTRALWAFAEMPPQSDEVLAALLAAAQDPNDAVQTNALRALAKYGPRARDAVPTAVAALESGSLMPAACYAAADVIGAIGPEAREAVPALVRRMRSVRNMGVQHEVEALCRIGTPDAVQAVLEHIDIELFRGGHPWCYVEALGFAGRDVLPQLLRWTEDPGPHGADLQISAMRAIVQLGPDAADAVPLLLERRDATDVRVSTWATYALVTIAPEAVPADEAIALFIERLGNTRYAPDAAHLGLVHLGGRAVPRLVEAFRAADGRRGPLVLRALGEMGPRAKEAMPLLEEVAGTPGHPARGAALKALGPVGMDAAELLPLLIGALDDGAAESAAAIALSRLGGLAKPALPALRARRKDPDQYVRDFVEDAILKIESAPEPDAGPPGPPPEEF